MKVRQRTAAAVVDMDALLRLFRSRAGAAAFSFASPNPNRAPSRFYRYRDGLYGLSNALLSALLAPVFAPPGAGIRIYASGRNRYCRPKLGSGVVIS
jgi:hypothetical protein